jgi:hypothetical protein
MVAKNKSQNGASLGKKKRKQSPKFDITSPIERTPAEAKQKVA